MDKYKGHTPGPWEAKLREDTGVTSAIEDKVSKEDFPYSIYVPSPPFALGAVGALIARKDGITSGPKEAEANAKLIADAPMLAEQRDKMLDFIKTQHCPMVCNIRRYPECKKVWALKSCVAQSLIAEIEGSQ